MACPCGAFNCLRYLRPVFLSTNVEQTPRMIVNQLYDRLILCGIQPLLVAHNARLMIRELNGNENEDTEKVIRFIYF